MTRRRGRDCYRPRELRRARHETSCADLTAFVHGELAPARAAAFHRHLALCEPCRRELPSDVALAARLSDLLGGGR